MLKSKAIIIFTLTVFTLSACVTKTSMKGLGPGESFDSSRGQALVFGKIVIIENGKEWPYIDARPVASLFHLESKKYFVAPEPSKDGSLVWVVPRGTYVVSEIKLFSTYVPGPIIVSPQISFQTPSEGEVFYLGTLKVDLEAAGRWWSMMTHVKKVTIADEFDSAKEEFIKQNPNLSAAIEKRLAIHDSSISKDRRLERERVWKGTLLLIVLTELSLFFGFY